ncbi:MAG TPA: hypothetical protein VME23_18150 [Terracidiphilus sp.]|nr:hypothetical protein [Terracidiphilus sp.]
MFRMKVKRVTLVLALIAVLLLTARTMHSFSRFHAVAERFDSVHEGQSWDSVIALLGRPNYHEGSCLQDLSGSGCVRELVYSYPFAPLIPEYYVVDFSANDRVIWTAHLNSP